MVHREEYFKTILWNLDRDQSFETLIERNSWNNVFGDNFSMVALSIVISRPIYSFSPYCNFLTNPYNEQTFPVKFFYMILIFLQYYL